MFRRLGLALMLSLPALAQAARPSFDTPEAPREVRLSPLIIKSAVASAKHQAHRFAVGSTLMLDTSAGTWDEPSPGQARWRLRIISEGAHSLSFEFQQLRLPPGAELWVYDRHGRDVQGPITAGTNLSTWSPLVRGAEALIEANMASAQQANFAVVVAQAFHAFEEISGRSFPQSPGSGTGNGASGACNVDVACTDGDAWQPQSRSTVMLTIAGTSMCSGTLVNNARQDDRPLILTADHCGITDLNVESTIAYFNVQRSACSSGSYGSLMQNLRGKTLLTRARTGSGSDFALFELASKPPTSFNVYYSGFDVSGAVPTSGIGIHHPSGDDKKISRFTSPAFAQSDVCIGSRCGLLSTEGFEIDAWSVIWSKGTTEGGSSGSAIWNQSGHLVGTLSGGYNQCSTALSNNGGVDYYARLDTAWSQAGAGLLATSLKAVLDPQDSGCTAVNGKAPGTAAPLNCVTPSAPDPGNNSPPDPVVTPTDGGTSGGGGGLGLSLLPLLLAGLFRRRLRSIRQNSRPKSTWPGLPKGSRELINTLIAPPGSPQTTRRTGLLHAAESGGSGELNEVGVIESRKFGE